jgi:predicted dehydrogenase
MCIYHLIMPDKVRFGVLSTAKIGLKKVIPAMQLGTFCEVAAIASRDLASAQKAADDLGIPQAYGSYEALLADPQIDAIYNPLPNDLHVPWTIKAARAGKHVLCEKPIALSADEARTLLAVEQETGKVIAEAFMVKLHPQWLRTEELIRTGRIGSLRLVTGTFSFFNDDPANIRNQPAHGGGALMDIGCYLIFAARQLFSAAAGKPVESTRVISLVDRDPTTHIDRLTSFILDFPAGQAIFSCSTQLVPSQRMQAFGTTGRIEIDVPFNAPPDRPSTILVDSTGDFLKTGIQAETFPAVDQYTLQGDAFARAVLDGTPPPVPVTAAIANMAVIDAIVRSAGTGQWEPVR